MDCFVAHAPRNDEAKVMGDNGRRCGRSNILVRDHKLSARHCEEPQATRQSIFG
jgi:hypothetical protein